MFSLDTAFHLVKSANPGDKKAEPPVVGFNERREMLWKEMRAAFLRTPLGGPAQWLAQRVRDAKRGRRNRNGEDGGSAAAPVNGAGAVLEPPPEANLRLLTRIEQVVKSGMPLLFVKAEDPGKASNFDYLGYILTRSRGRVMEKKIPFTDHGFLAGDGKPRLIDCVTEWMDKEFGEAGERRRSGAVN